MGGYAGRCEAEAVESRAEGNGSPTAGRQIEECYRGLESAGCVSDEGVTKVAADELDLATTRRNSDAGASCSMRDKAPAPEGSLGSRAVRMASFIRLAEELLGVTSQRFEELTELLGHIRLGHTKDRGCMGVSAVDDKVLALLSDHPVLVEQLQLLCCDGDAVGADASDCDGSAQEEDNSRSGSSCSCRDHSSAAVLEACVRGSEEQARSLL